ncbi:hypothetical protein LEP1GSC170_1428 [Leptospira interrogans serovar Bataviae str. HAI135]|nr:hypothetical protein LEP1GSC170_1428 [Leptospira interrogans serovar Bataviae str. HAI135]
MRVSTILEFVCKIVICSSSHKLSHITIFKHYFLYEFLQF